MDYQGQVFFFFERKIGNAGLAIVGGVAHNVVKRVILPCPIQVGIIDLEREVWGHEGWLNGREVSSEYLGRGELVGEIAGGKKKSWVRLVKALRGGGRTRSERFVLGCRMYVVTLPIFLTKPGQSVVAPRRTSRTRSPVPVPISRTFCSEIQQLPKRSTGASWVLVPGCSCPAAPCTVYRPVRECTHDA